MDLIIKIALAAIVIAAICLTVKSIRPEMAIPISVAAVIALIVALFPDLRDAVTQMRDFAEKTELGLGNQREAMGALLKIIGVTYVTHFTVEICRSSGELSLASGVELAGKIAVVLITVPLASNLLGLIENLL